MSRTPVLVLLVLAACGDPAPPAAPAPPPPAVALPRVTNVGMPPADLLPPPTVLTVGRDGAMVLDGAPVPAGAAGLLEEARARWREVVGKARGAGGTGHRASTVPLVLRCDEVVPWRVVQVALAAVADPRIRIWRVLFAVRPMEGEDEGTFALYVPRGRGISGSARERVRRAPVRLTLSPAAAWNAPPAALYAYFRDRPEYRGVHLTVDPRASTGTVLASLDMLHRAGVTRIVLGDAEVPRPDERFPAAADRPAPVDYLVGSGEDGEPVLAPVGGLPVLPPLPRAGGLAGFTTPPDVLPDDGD